MTDQWVLLDYGRGKYHIPDERLSWVIDSPRCGADVDPGGNPPRIKFEDEVAPEDICKNCLRRAAA